MKQVLKILCRIFVIQIFFVSTNGFTKTTPDKREDFENMTPSRTNVDSSTVTIYTKRQPYNYRAKKPHQMTRLEIWKWDERCQKQPVIGNCKQELRRYSLFKYLLCPALSALFPYPWANLDIKFFYEVSRKQCVNFTYSGCDGNMNNFDSLYECQRNCRGALTPVFRRADNSFCAMQPHAGMCFDIYTRYYYDVNQRRCLKFIYGGCGGNENNFVTEAKCMHVCRGMTLQESTEKFLEVDDGSASVLK